MPSMNPNSSDSLSHQATPSVDFESQVRDHSIPQHHDNQHVPPAKFPYESAVNFAPKQYEDLQLFYQTYCDTQAGNTGFATKAVLIPTPHGLSQEVEQPLANPSHSAPEAETLIDDYPSAFYTDLVKDAIPTEGFYAHCTESQPWAVLSLDPGHPSPSQSVTFPISQCHSSFQRRPEVQLSNEPLPEQYLSQAQFSKQPIGEIQSEYVSDCQLSGQSDVPVDPVLLSGAKVDLNPKQAAMLRVSTQTSSGTGSVLSRPNKQLPQKDMQGARVTKQYRRQRSHDSSKRPFECKTCGRGFVRERGMKRHEKICDPKSAASVTSGSVGADIEHAEGDNNYLNVSTNLDCGHAEIDHRTNDRPQLVRTGMTQKTGMDSNGPDISSSPAQAILKIVGGLESMAEEWTPQEWGNCRRIVLFHKRQKGATVIATCQSVSVNDIPPDSICISCIRWAEKEEYYVTSVDIVYLLEQLIGPKLFDRRERERVRCNLSAFKLESQIIRKNNSHTKAFFNLIMGFPDPKPRNLERDIKVFPWRILGDALKEVFQFYSVSPVAALNVDRDQRKFTTPEGKRMLSSARTSTTPQQACPVTEELEKSLMDPSHLAPETEELIDDHPSAFYATPANDNMLPEELDADYIESQPAEYEMAPYADMSPHSGHLRSSQSLPAQRDVPAGSVLMSNAQIDSNSQQATIPRLSTPEFSGSLKILPATGGVLAKLGDKASQRNMHKAKAAKERSKEVLLCPFCLKTNPTLRDHERHLKTHTLERPYQCKWRHCTKEFAREDNQKRHIRKCKHKPAASVTSDGVGEGFYSLSQEQHPPDPEPPSPLGGNDYPDTSTNRDNGHALVDGEFNNALQLIQTSTDSANARNDTNCRLTSSDPSKAVLKITGDLKLMEENWSMQDKAKHRRIVVFRRTRNGLTLNTTFELLSINSQSDGEGRVSCMLRPDDGECYITSADIILLVEYLVDTKKPFSLPERNLIRTTLNEFDPTTIFEKDTASQDFHKIIMGFSNPKPFLVRKNSIRVHPWNRLESALKAIIERYGFSLGSTRAKLQSPRYLMPQPQRMECNRRSQRQKYPINLQRTHNFTSKPELLSSELPVLSTSNIIREVYSEIPHQARPDQGSNPTSPQNESNLSGTLIQDESDSEIVKDEIVMCAPTPSLEEHVAVFDETYKDTEEKARGSKPSATYDNDDWGYAIADGKITIHYKNTLLTNFDREVPVRGMCPGVQNILDRIHEFFQQGDIKQQQEDETEAEQIHIKGRTRPMTQHNISFSENTDEQQFSENDEPQQFSEETYATIDELQKMLPESKGLDLSRISKSKLDDILKAVQEVLNTIQQVLIESWTEEVEPAKQLLEEFWYYCTSK